MNFLALCQRVHEIGGFQGQFNSVDATGYQKVIVQSVQDAYEDIQRYRREWNWLKAKRDINVGDGKDQYTLTDLWAGDTPDLAEYRHINYSDGRNTHRLRFVDYDQFMLMNFSEPNAPRLWTSVPWSKDLLISPVDKVYTLELHYVRTLDELVNNIDEPDIPLRHRQLIVYGALLKVSTYIGNPTLYDTYAVKYAEEMGQLMREENPAKRVAKRPIA